MLKKYKHLVLVFFLIFSTKIKSMDNGFFNCDFGSIVYPILSSILPSNSIGLESQAQPQAQPQVQLQAEQQSFFSQEIIYPIVRNNEKIIAYSVTTHNDNGTSIRRYPFDRQTKKEVTVSGFGRVYLYQAEKNAQEFIEIHAKTVDIKRFDIHFFGRDKKVVIGPNGLNDKSAYDCHICLKEMPKILLKDSVRLTLATNITSELLCLELKDSASILPSSKRLKVPALSLILRGHSRVVGLQGLAVDQFVSLFDRAEYVSYLKSNLIRIKANQRSKACFHLPSNDSRRPTTIEGELLSANVLQYSGNKPLMNGLDCHTLSLIERVKPV